MKQTEETLCTLAKQLMVALDDLIDGKSCYDLSGMTGWSKQHCQTQFIDLLKHAKDLLGE